MATFHHWKYKQYFTLKLNDDLRSDNEKNMTVQCQLCLPKVRTLSTSKTSTSNLMKHLMKKHQNIRLISNKTGKPISKQPKISDTVNHIELIAEYIINDMHPLSVVESPNFIKLLHGISSKKFNIPNEKTVSNFIEEKFNYHKKLLTQDTFKNIHYVCTTADMWTSHNKSYIGMTAHWICPISLVRKKAGLMCSRFYGNHTYSSIAEHISNVHKEFGVDLKVTDIVTDNSSYFMKALSIFNIAKPDWEEIEECEFVNIKEILESPGESEIISLPPLERCATHTLNLISKGIEKLISEQNHITFKSALDKCTKLWNKCNRLNSDTEINKEIAQLKLMIPTKTCWNSQFNAVKQIVEMNSKRLIDLFINLKIPPFTENEFKILKQYTIVTQPFSDALSILQGKDYCFHGTLIPILYTLKRKLSSLEETDLLPGVSDVILTSLDAEFSKIMDNKNARLAAVSHPSFKNAFTQDYQEKLDLQNLLLDEMKMVNVKKENAYKGLENVTKTNSFFDFNEDPISTDMEIELHNYLKSCKSINELASYPTIKTIFLHYNTTLPSSAPVESLFNLDGYILTPHRQRLNDKQFEKLSLLRYNHQ